MRFRQKPRQTSSFRINFAEMRHTHVAAICTERRSPAALNYEVQIISHAPFYRYCCLQQQKRTDCVSYDEYL